MEDNLGPFHVPQQSRRHKLRFAPPQNDAVAVVGVQQQQPPPHFLSPHHPHHHDSSTAMAATTTTSSLNLSLSTHARPAGAYTASPVGPFTGYASILGRSRFLRPAQELLEDFCRGNGVSSVEKETSKLLEGSGSWFSDDDDDISRRCTNPTLISMLHEVYKRYKLYCQQMHSAVTSFESVAGLGNAAPFICFAIKAMFRHFQCLKRAILDHIRVTSKVHDSVDVRKGCISGSCSEDKGGLYDQKQVLDSSLLQHPVWRSQRGFPDKAVAVLRTWLFEHFLHPYPSDSDKQMLAQKTGLSRSQVSNWFTNARVRLWKPMVEEMHALERKTECSKADNTQKISHLSTDHQFSVHYPQQSQKDFQIYTHRDEDNHCKRSRIEVFPRAEQSKEPFGIPWNHLSNNPPVINVGGTRTAENISLSSSGLGNNQENASGLSWPTTQAQIVPFWLAKQ